jgi:ABC-type transport system substrate-binding protein
MNHTATIMLHQLYDSKNDCEARQIIEAGKKYHLDIRFKYHQDYSELLPLYQNHNLDGFLDLYTFKNREAYKVFEFFSISGENDANITDDNIDNLLTEASSMSSSHGRFQLYRKLAQYMQDKNIIIPMFYMDHGNLVNQCISGISEDFYFNPFSFLPQLSKIDDCYKSTGTNKNAR